MFLYHKIKKFKLSGLENVFFRISTSILVIFIAYVIFGNLVVNTLGIPQFGTYLLFLGLGIIFGTILLLYKILSKPSTLFDEISEKSFLILFSLCFIAIRVIWILVTDVKPISDFSLYNNMSIEFLKGDISQKVYIAKFPHVIGYPFILSIIYKVFGQSIIVAQLFNIVCSLCTSLMLYSISKVILNVTLAKYALLFNGFWISQIFYITIVATESLFTMLMVFVLFLFTKTFENNNPHKLVFLFSLIGLFASFANAIRPLSLILILAIFIYTILSYFKKSKVFILISLVSMIFVYTGSNIIIKGSIENFIGRPLAKNSFAFTLLVGSNTTYHGAWNSEDSKLFYDLNENKSMSIDEVNKVVIAKVKAKIQGNLPRTIAFYLNKNINIWGSESYGIYWNILSMNEVNGFSGINPIVLFTFVIISELFYYLILLLIILGLALSFWNKKNEKMTFIFILIFGFISILIPSEVQSRYHYSALPLLAICGAYSIYCIRSFSAQHQEKQCDVTSSFTGELSLKS